MERGVSFAASAIALLPAILTTIVGICVDQVMTNNVFVIALDTLTFPVPSFSLIGGFGFKDQVKDFPGSDGLSGQVDEGPHW
jgi:hypothetical protein